MLDNMRYSDGRDKATITADMAGVESELKKLAKSIGEITVQVNPTPITVEPAQLVAEIDLGPIQNALEDIARKEFDFEPVINNYVATPVVSNYNSVDFGELRIPLYMISAAAWVFAILKMYELFK